MTDSYTDIMQLNCGTRRADAGIDRYGYEGGQQKPVAHPT
jgi:hypothetical protein